MKKKTNIKCLNIRGLALSSSKAKVSIIEDILENDSSIGIFLSETWLEELIYDAEIQINNFNIHRSDRSIRQRGGAALYLRKELNCKTFSAFSNSVVETLIAMCKKFYTVFICVYRPSATKDKEWANAIEQLNEQIEFGAIK